MIGLDTNVVLRYLVQDDAVQSPIATRIINALTTAKQGFISTVSFTEIVWVMEAVYQAPKERVIQVLDLLLRTPELNIENAENAGRALRIFIASNTDFADCLIACSAAAAGCAHTLTFDRKAAKIDGMLLAR